MKLRRFQNASALTITISWLVAHLIIPIRLVMRQRAEQKRNVGLKNESRTSAPGVPMRRTSAMRDDGDGTPLSCSRRGCLPSLIGAVSRQRQVLPLARPPHLSGAASVNGNGAAGNSIDKRAADLVRSSNAGSATIEPDQSFSRRGPSRDGPRPGMLSGGASGGAGSLRSLLSAGLPSQSSLPQPAERVRTAAAVGGSGRVAAAHFGSSSRTAAESDDAGGEKMSPVWRNNLLTRGPVKEPGAGRGAE